MQLSTLFPAVTTLFAVVTQSVPGCHWWFQSNRRPHLGDLNKVDQASACSLVPLAIECHWSPFITQSHLEALSAASMLLLMTLLLLTPALIKCYHPGCSIGISFVADSLAHCHHDGLEDLIMFPVMVPLAQCLGAAAQNVFKVSCLGTHGGLQVFLLCPM